MKEEIETVKYYKHYLYMTRKDIQASMFMGIIGIFLMNIFIGFLIQNVEVGYLILFLNGLGLLGTLVFLRILKKFKFEKPED